MGKSMSIARNVTKTPLAAKEIIKLNLYSTKANGNSANNNDRARARLRSKPTADYLKSVNEIDQGLNHRLKQVYVTSIDKNPDFDSTAIKKPMDKSAQFISTHTEEVDRPEPEKLSLNELTTLLSNHQKDPQEWTSTRVSETFGINDENSNNLLKYFKSFEVYLPNEQSPTNSKLAPTEVFKNRMTSNSTFPEVEEMFKASPRKPKDGN